MKFNELLNEMATCYSDNKTIVFVNPVDSGNFAYFKYGDSPRFNSETAIARISLLEPEYIYNHNDGHPSLVLSSKAKKQLNDKLQSPSKKYLGYTVFQSIIIDYNIEKFGVYLEETKSIKEYRFGNPLPLSLEQPDYRNLSSEEEARKKISKRVYSL